MKTSQWTLRRRLLVLFIVALSIAGFMTYYIGYNYHFHTVIPEQVYRSGEMSGPDFEAYIKKYHIQSIINLRGYDQGEPWFDAEIKAAQATGIHHYDINLPAKGLPAPWRVARLVMLIETAPRPLLLHCNHGVDRTGFASSLVVILTGNPSWSAAKSQYSYRYLRVDPRSIAPSVMSHYEKWLEKNNLVHSRDNFLRWVNASVAANTFDP